MFNSNAVLILWQTLTSCCLNLFSLIIVTHTHAAVRRPKSHSQWSAIIVTGLLRLNISKNANVLPQAYIL